MFSCEIWEILKNTYSEEYLRTTASVVSFSWLYVHCLRHRFINQKQNAKTEVHIFTKIKNKDRSKYKKRNFQLIHFRKSEFFIFAFLQKMLMFPRSIPLIVLSLIISSASRIFCSTRSIPVRLLVQ